jgi:hypothetical protein
MSRFGILTAVVVATLSTQAHAVGSLADVSIYDRNEGRELPVYYKNGKYYVAGKPGNEYQITLRSQSGRDVLGVVSVDGVNVVSGETATPYQSGYMLTPWQQTDIKGWRKSTDRVARFYFTELPDSYAARTDRPDDVGVIGVAVFRSKQYDPPSRDYDYRPYNKGGPFPEESRRYGVPESKAQSQSAPSYEGNRRSPQPDDSLGTGHGREERSKVRQVEFERESSRPNEVITIYYDSYRNLVAAGVIPEKRYAHRHEPHPFPGQFVPDPWRRW